MGLANVQLVNISLRLTLPALACGAKLFSAFLSPVRVDPDSKTTLNQCCFSIAKGVVLPLFSDVENDSNAHIDSWLIQHCFNVILRCIQTQKQR